MNRRDALQRVAWMMGGAISAPSLVAMLQGCSSGPAAGSPFALSADYQALVAELANEYTYSKYSSGAFVFLTVAGFS